MKIKLFAFSELARKNSQNEKPSTGDDVSCLYKLFFQIHYVYRRKQNWRHWLEKRQQPQRQQTCCYARIQQRGSAALSRPWQRARSLDAPRLCKYYLDIVPKSQKTDCVFITKINCLLFRKIIWLFWESYTRCEQNAKFLNIKARVHIVNTVLLKG